MFLQNKKLCCPGKVFTFQKHECLKLLHTASRLTRIGFRMSMLEWSTCSAESSFSLGKLQSLETSCSPSWITSSNFDPLHRLVKCNWYPCKNTWKHFMERETSKTGLQRGKAGSVQLCTVQCIRALSRPLECTKTQSDRKHKVWMFCLTHRLPHSFPCEGKSLVQLLFSKVGHMIQEIGIESLNSWNHFYYFIREKHSHYFGTYDMLNCGWAELWKKSIHTIYLQV